VVFTACVVFSFFFFFEGRGGKLGLLSAETIPHAFSCTGFLFCTS
jgi:hypothetical protein